MRLWYVKIEDHDGDADWEAFVWAETPQQAEKLLGEYSGHAEFETERTTHVYRVPAVQNVEAGVVPWDAVEAHIIEGGTNA